MKRLDTPVEANGYRIHGVSDWLCYITDAKGNWFVFYTECDPVWATLPANLRRHAIGVEDEADYDEADQAIVEVGRRKLLLGHIPESLDPEYVEEAVQAFG